MQKKIVKVSPAAFRHLMLGFEDWVKQLVHRGDHEAHAPKAGDLWPPDDHEHVTSGVQAGALRKKEYIGCAQEGGIVELIEMHLHGAKKL